MAAGGTGCHSARMLSTRSRPPADDARPLTLNRREFAALTGGVLASWAAGAACDYPGPLAAQSDGRLTARPRGAGKTSATGVQALGLDSTRDAWVVVPERDSSSALPLVVMLHGAGGSAERFLKRFAQAPADAGVALLVPSSRSSTWDAVRGGMGPDVTFLDRALSRVFELVNVDPVRLGIGGFSDGASYALTLGLINGDLFRRVIAFSPGFVVEGAAHGKPQFFISHGTSDQILPIDQCSRRIVPNLKQHGYDVTFRGLDGGHEVPPAVAAEALKWAAA
jgi:phospholipase/carboxylesterase